ncbi:MAG: alpha/beta fold hydrolase [Alphaproteobacteria bacterium]
MTVLPARPDGAETTPVSSFAALPARADNAARRKPGGRMHFLDWGGSGRPPLVFVHANGLNARTYRQMLTPLAKRFRVIAPDLRGHGLSELPARPGPDHSWDIYVRDLIAFLEPHGPVLLGGHSMGGAVSLMTAAARPDLVRGLAIAEPVILPPAFYWLMRLRRTLGWRGHVYPIARNAARRRAVWPSARAVFRAYRGRGAFRNWPREALEDYIAHGVRPRADGQVELACAPEWEAENFSAHCSRLWRHLSEVSCPVRVWCGTERSTFMPAARGRFRRVLPRARIEAIEGAGHFLPIEQPKILREGIIALQEELASGH